MRIMVRVIEALVVVPVACYLVSDKSVVRDMFITNPLELEHDIRILEFFLNT